MNSSILNPKIDTKEKMHVLTFEEGDFRANMSAGFKSLTTAYLQKPVKNLVLNFEHVASVDEAFAGTMAELQQEFHDNGASLVFCGFQPGVKSFLEVCDLLDMMNHTPTESEAWDIVQMEEIERELLD